MSTDDWSPDFYQDAQCNLSSLMPILQEYLTAEDEIQILQQFDHEWRRNEQVLWTGIPREKAQVWADEHHMQTLTTAMGPLMAKHSPSTLKKKKDNKKGSLYIKGASAVFAWRILRGEIVTVLSPPPPERFHPSGLTNYQAIEEPILKWAMKDKNTFRIEMVHPTVRGAEEFRYQVWPVDETVAWIARFSAVTIEKRRWRAVGSNPKQSETKRRLAEITGNSDFKKAVGEGKQGSTLNRSAPATELIENQEGNPHSADDAHNVINDPTNLDEKESQRKKKLNKMEAKTKPNESKLNWKSKSKSNPKKKRSKKNKKTKSKALQPRHLLVPISQPRTTQSLDIASKPLNQSANQRSAVSPYSSPLIPLYFTEDRIPYYVPRDLLQSPYWIESCSEQETPCVNLPSIDAATGHVLIHYLYTGTYQTLENLSMCTVHEARAFEFRQAVRAYSAARMYALTNLQALARTKIEDFAHRMSTLDVLCSLDECYPVDLDQGGWLAGWLGERVVATFREDLPLFTFGDLMDRVGDGDLAGILKNCVEVLWGQGALGGIIARRVHRSGLITGDRDSD